MTQAARLSLLVVVGRGTLDIATGRVAGCGGVGIVFGATGEGGTIIAGATGVGGAMIIAEAAGGGTIIVAATTG